MNINANALSPFRIAIKLIRIFALSELSSHLKNTQLLANGSVEYAQWGKNVGRKMENVCHQKGPQTEDRSA